MRTGSLVIDLLTDLMGVVPAACDYAEARHVDRLIETVAVRNGAIVLQFTQVAGKSYSVLYRDSFSGGAWLKLKDVSPSSITTMTEVVAAPPVDSRERYYRLVTPTIR